MRILTKKRVAAAVAALAIGGGGMAAYAYFTAASGSGSHTAPVGTSTAWQVSVGAFSANLYPGGPSTTATYTVTNPGSGHQGFTGVTATLGTSGSDVTSGGVDVAGCLSSWFSVSAGAPAATDVAPGANTTGQVSITFNNDTATSQDACKNKSPDVTVTAS